MCIKFYFTSVVKSGFNKLGYSLTTQRYDDEYLLHTGLVGRTYTALNYPVVDRFG